MQQNQHKNAASLETDQKVWISSFNYHFTLHEAKVLKIYMNKDHEVLDDSYLSHMQLKETSTVLREF